MQHRARCGAITACPRWRSRRAACRAWALWQQHPGMTAPARPFRARRHPGSTAARSLGTPASWDPAPRPSGRAGARQSPAQRNRPGGTVGAMSAEQPPGRPFDGVGECGPRSASRSSWPSTSASTCTPARTTPTRSCRTWRPGGPPTCSRPRCRPGRSSSWTRPQAAGRALYNAIGASNLTALTGTPAEQRLDRLGRLVHRQRLTCGVTSTDTNATPRAVTRRKELDTSGHRPRGDRSCFRLPYLHAFFM